MKQNYIPYLFVMNSKLNESNSVRNVINGDNSYSLLSLPVISLRLEPHAAVIVNNPDNNALITFIINYQSVYSR